MAPYESARVPAWKKLGLKLKPAAESTNGATQPIISDQTQTPSALKRKPREEAPAAAKRAKTETPRKTVGEAPAKTQTSAKRSPASIQPALDYLRQWRTARASWKFNKNHQTTLIRHALDPALVPAADVDAFYAYIRDLQGFTRTRLREAALEARDNPGVAPENRAAYEDLVRRVSGDEAEVLASGSDDDVVRRVVARMRAQAVLEALSGESADEGDKRVKLNDGTGKRRRKLRVNDESESSSEESSESDTSSSGSSSSEEEEEGGESGSEDGEESSSSSSSSSSSEDEDEDEDEDESSSDGTAA